MWGGPFSLPARRGAWYGEEGGGAARHGKPAPRSMAFQLGAASGWRSGRHPECPLDGRDWKW